MKEILLLSFCLWLHQTEAQPSATQSNEICRYPVQPDFFEGVQHYNAREILMKNKVVRQIDRLFAAKDSEANSMDTLETFIHQYNHKGLRTNVHLMTKKVHYRTECAYQNDTVLTVKKVFYDMKGHKSYTRIFGYEYDDYGLLSSRRVSILGGGQPTLRYAELFKYDEYQRVKSIDFSDWTTTYEYDCEQNTLVIQSRMGYKTIQKYNQSGVLLGMDSYQNGKNLYKSIYSYNENNQLSVEILQVLDKAHFENMHEYGTYKKGDILRQEYNYLPNGLLDQVKKYKNDILQTLFTTEYKYL